MMVTHNASFDAYQGADIVINFTIFRRDLYTPMNITSWTLSAFFGREGQPDREDDLTKTIGNGITVTEPLEGIGYITIPRVQSLEMDTTRWVWDLWRTNAGYDQPVALGTFSLSETARSRSSM